MDLNEILKLSVEGLRARLTELGLPTTGRKQDLQDRLKVHFDLGNEHSDPIGDEVSSRHVDSTLVRSNLFTLKDIEDSLTSFCGDESIDVIHWVEDFEDNADAVGWNQLQKFIYPEPKWSKELEHAQGRINKRIRNEVSSDRCTPDAEKPKKEEHREL